MNDPQRKPGIVRPFKKNDPRINRSGRPKHFDQFRALAQKIAHEKVPGPDGNALTTIELILRRWSKSKEPALQRAFVEYAFGKVPEKLETTGLEGQKPFRLVLHYGNEQHGHIARLPAGLSEQAKGYPSSARVFPGPAQMKLIRDGDGEQDLPAPPPDTEQK